ncbi:hypothetical protein PIB30_072282 [Stylosanthes scabra]|uniref:Prolactin receptor n=1 Tax=Stylosanthes scabra TaxID=79078 RepID=A0ABU6ZMM7_9FABA|nr:hypothetical protein [Stylosanthes scabra]
MGFPVRNKRPTLNSDIYLIPSVITQEKLVAGTLAGGPPAATVSRDISLCPTWKTMKEEPDPSLNKAEIKRNKSGVEQASCADKFQHIQLASEAPYQAISVCHNKQKLTVDASPMKIDPP